MEIIEPASIALVFAFIDYFIAIVILRIYLNNRNKYSRIIKPPIVLGSGLVFISSTVIIGLAKIVATHKYDYGDLRAMYYGYRTYVNENEFFSILYILLPLNLIIGIWYTFKLGISEN